MPAAEDFNGCLLKTHLVLRLNNTKEANKNCTTNSYIDRFNEPISFDFSDSDQKNQMKSAH